MKVSGSSRTCRGGEGRSQGLSEERFGFGGFGCRVERV